MTRVTDAEVQLILEALEDAAYYRDTRSRVLDSALRRHTRRPLAARSAEDEHRDKARAYAALAVKLKGDLERRGAPAAPKRSP